MSSYNAPSKLTIKMRHNIKFKSKGTLKIRNTAQISLWKKCSDSMIADQTYLFINRVQDRRFDEESLRILELSLVAMNVKSFLEVRSRLRDFMRSESVVIFGELTGESMVAKLSVLEFFARAFALLGDMESCLAMRYEALNLRQLKSPSCLWLGVSHSEWTKFAVQSMENGFPSIAGKASENALLSLKKDSLIEPKSEDNSDILDAAEKVRRLRDSAASLTSSHSVQAQGAGYLRSKEHRIQSRQTLPTKNPDCTGSNLFREGIKKRNERMLQDLRSIRMNRNLEPDVRCV